MNKKFFIPLILFSIGSSASTQNYLGVFLAKHGLVGLNPALSDFKLEPIQLDSQSSRFLVTQRALKEDKIRMEINLNLDFLPIVLGQARASLLGFP